MPAMVWRAYTDTRRAVYPGGGGVEVVGRAGDGGGLDEAEGDEDEGAS